VLCYIIKGQLVRITQTHSMLVWIAIVKSTLVCGHDVWI